MAGAPGSYFTETDGSATALLKPPAVRVELIPVGGLTPTPFLPSPYTPVAASYLPTEPMVGNLSVPLAGAQATCLAAAESSGPVVTNRILLRNGSDIQLRDGSILDHR